MEKKTKNKINNKKSKEESIELIKKLRPNYYLIEDIEKKLPKLRGLYGRFFDLYAKEFLDKIEEFSELAKNQLGDRKCATTYPLKDGEFYLCDECINFSCHDDNEYGDQGDYCMKAPKLGQTWVGDSEDTPATLIHQNGTPYWMIIKCPDFKGGRIKKNAKEMMEKDYDSDGNWML